MNRQSTYQNNSPPHDITWGSSFCKQLLLRKLNGDYFNCDCFVSRVNKSCAFATEVRYFKSFKKACQSHCMLLMSAYKIVSDTMTLLVLRE